MRRFGLWFFVLGALVLIGGPLSHVRAENSAQAQRNSTVASLSPPIGDKYVRRILDELQLSDRRTVDQIRDLCSAHFAALAAWHRENDPSLKSLWTQFDEARVAKNPVAADAALDRIASVYSSFRPQHDAFLARLATALTPAQIQRVEDVLTVDKVKVTFNAYNEIFPILNEAQKAVVLAELKAARTEAIDAMSMTEKSAFFKKHKIIIEEHYFPTQGIDAQKFRRAFAAKSTPPTKPASSPTTTAAGVPLVLWYQQPAAKWDDALPIGSGRLGAMIFGGVPEERIQFNEDTLWTGQPHDYVRAGSGDALPEVRRLLAAGKIKEAETLGRARLLSDPVRQKAYQPFGDLRLHFAGHRTPQNYRRELDLDSAVALTRYEVDGVTYTRQVIASFPDNVIAVHLTASRPGSLSLTVGLDSPHHDSSTKASRNEVTVGAALRRDLLTLTGRVEPDGLRFESRVQADITGGTVRASNDSLEIEHADSVTLFLVAATSFKNFQDISADPASRCAEALAKVADRRFESLLATHQADHQRLFRAVQLDLGRNPTADLPTDERLRRVKAAASLDGDPALAALEFQYGRYLLIASSRPGSQPANLQGVWNSLLRPPWESKYTTNINYEMNYWLADLTGLGECLEPFFDTVDDLRISGARTARKLYGSRGWVLHHNFDLWRGTAPINNIDGLWPTGGAWLCEHLWEHWRFTGDRKFLEQRAFPAMKEASLFFIDSLVHDPKTDWLVTSPSFSPEQGHLTMGPTMDNQLIRALWEHTIAAGHILGLDAELIQQLETLLPKLPPNQVGQHGQLQEWLEDVDVPNNHHRHLSPLWALYPGNDITPAEPRLFAAAKKLLEWRGDGSTGWSYAWRIPLWARVNDGEFAYRQLSLLLTKRTLPNLFDLCGPFQIDGNFGATAGIAEMLLQSHQRSGATAAGPESSSTIIDLLPALPKSWPTGSFTGLRAREGFAIDVAWADGKLTQATIHSHLGRPGQVRYAGQNVDLRLVAGQSISLDSHLRQR